MNRLPIRHWAALVPLILGAWVLFVTLASISGVCVAPAADASVNNAEASSKPSHCLIYGKYCLGDTLRSR
jgi:hypothetical protein